jgi:heme-degrading monooxygenase HmoA
MYGTVAQLRLIPGKRDLMVEKFSAMGGVLDPGEVATYLYKLDNDPDGLIIATVFESKEAYQANANRLDTHARFLQIRSFLQEDPAWHDGEVIKHE